MLSISNYYHTSFQAKIRIKKPNLNVLTEQSAPAASAFTKAANETCQDLSTTAISSLIPLASISTSGAIIASSLPTSGGSTPEPFEQAMINSVKAESGIGVGIYGFLSASTIAEASAAAIKNSGEPENKSTEIPS